MTGLVIAVVVLAGAAYVALRRVKPVGIALDPWPYVLRNDRMTRFERNLPEPDEEICDADPPAELLRGLEAFGFVGLTRCYYRPHPRRPGIAHTGLLISRDTAPHGVDLMQAYTWIEDEHLMRVAAHRRRVARWRRLLIRIASS